MVVGAGRSKVLQDLVDVHISALWVHIINILEGQLWCDRPAHAGGLLILRSTM